MTGILFGFNPYEYLHKQLKPNWSDVIEGRENKIFSNIILTNSIGYDVKEIKSFNYEALKG